MPPPDASIARDAERRHLTVMFCDLVGSTALAEQLDDEDLREVIRRYYDACAETIAGYEGHLANYLGDGLLAYFGYPMAHEDDAERAVRAGLDMLRRLERDLNATLEVEHGIRLAARIGIHTGSVVVGDLGGGAKRDAMALGETLNLAARLQSVADPGAVVISGATRRVVHGIFILDDLGPQQLKGIGEPVTAFRVVRPSGVRSRLDLAEGSLTPFVGRDAEIGVLLERWERIQERSGQTVLISGEAGVGKSRLALAFRERLADAPHAWLECRCSPYTERTAFHPVTEFFAQRLAFGTADSPAEKIATLERALTVASLSLPETVPLLANFLGVPLPDAYAPLGLLPDVQRRRTLEALVAWTLALAEVQPVVLFVEDLHWCDPSTLELLGRLIERSPTARVLLVCTTRPDFTAPWPTGSNLTPLHLARLEKRPAREMVEALSESQPLPEPVIELILGRADGVPLYAEELTRMVLESGMMTARDGRWELAAPLAKLTIPATLQASLMARLDRLGPEKHVAQLASVIGREFSRALLEPLAPGSASELDAALARLVATDLVRERSGVRGAFLFKHALVQEAAYASLLRRRRRQIHGQVARALERTSEHAAAAPEVVARHYAGAGEVERAIDYYRKAGDQAMRHSAHAEAIQHFSSAIGLVSDLGDSRRRAETELALQTALAAPLVASRGYGNAEVERVHRRAHALCHEVGEGPDLHQAISGLFLVHQARAELEPAAERSAELLALGERRRDDFVIQWGCFFSSVPCFYRGAYRASLDYLERGLALYDPDARLAAGYVQEHDVGLSLLCYGAMAGWTLGTADRALGWIERAVEIARGSAHPFKLAFTQSFATLVHCLRGDPRRVLESSAEVVRICAEQEFPVYLSLALMLEGWATAHLGDAERGLDTLRRALVQAARTKTRIEAPRALGLLAEAQLLAGQTQPALDSIASALAMADLNGTHFWDAELMRLRGRALLQREPGAAAEAMECFQRARAVARAQEARALELRAALSEAHCLVQRGEDGAAKGLVAPIYASFREGLDLPDLCSARALLGAAS